MELGLENNMNLIKDKLKRFWKWILGLTATTALAISMVPIGEINKLEATLKTEQQAYFTTNGEYLQILSQTTASGLEYKVDVYDGSQGKGYTITFNDVDRGRKTIGHGNENRSYNWIKSPTIDKTILP